MIMSKIVTDKLTNVTNGFKGLTKRTPKTKFILPVEDRIHSSEYTSDKYPLEPVLFFTINSEENIYAIGVPRVGSFMFNKGKGNYIYLKSVSDLRKNIEPHLFKFHKGELFPYKMGHLRVIPQDETWDKTPLLLMEKSKVTAPTNFQQFAIEDNEIPLPEVKSTGDVGVSPPALTSQNPPVSQSSHAVRVAHIPFFMVNDKSFSSEVEQMQKSPYYSLERRIRFITKGAWFISNDTEEPQSKSIATTHGWSKTKSDEFSVTTGLSMSVGSSLFGVTVETSLELGFSHSSSLTVSKEVTETLNIVAPAFSSVAMWQAESEFVLKRTDGKEVARWTRGEDGIYYTEYDHKKSRSYTNQWDRGNGKWKKITNRRIAELVE